MGTIVSRGSKMVSHFIPIGFLLGFYSFNNRFYCSFYYQQENTVLRIKSITQMHVVESRKEECIARFSNIRLELFEFYQKCRFLSIYYISVSPLYQLLMSSLRVLCSYNLFWQVLYSILRKQTLSLRYTHWKCINVVVVFCGVFVRFVKNFETTL